MTIWYALIAFVIAFAYTLMIRALAFKVELIPLGKLGTIRRTSINDGHILTLDAFGKLEKDMRVDARAVADVLDIKLSEYSAPKEYPEHLVSWGDTEDGTYYVSIRNGIALTFLFMPSMQGWSQRKIKGFHRRMKKIYDLEQRITIRRYQQWKTQSK